MFSSATWPPNPTRFDKVILNKILTFNICFSDHATGMNMNKTMQIPIFRFNDSGQIHRGIVRIGASHQSGEGLETVISIVKVHFPAREARRGKQRNPLYFHSNDAIPGARSAPGPLGSNTFASL